jgi:hypothetical protein
MNFHIFSVYFLSQVSSDILRAQGYTQQFKSLLSSGTRARRDSVPGSSSEAVAAAAAKARGAISQQQSLGKFSFCICANFITS